MQTNPNYEKRCAELESVIANAIIAMDEGRRGDVRRILTTGNDRAVVAGTGVIARNFGA